MTAHQDYKLALQAFQSQRLRRDLADLAAEAQYQQIGQFFFDEMYGARDFNARDDQAHRAQRASTSATVTAPMVCAWCSISTRAVWR
jgi:hypothetical protein